MDDIIKSHNKTVYEALGRSPIHPFPARMAPGIALDTLSSNKKVPLRVLDPMMGSGTVLAMARSLGHHAIGVDSDPLAVLMSRVWTSTIDADSTLTKARDVLKRSKSLFKKLPHREGYPFGADEETKQFTRYWFDEHARRQLAALSRVIRRVHDDKARDVLWCALSRLIITKQAGASLALDLSHSRPHKYFDRAPVKPFDKFMTAVSTVTTNCIRGENGIVGPKTKTVHGDARDLAVPDASVDYVLTSPPYLNAIDYMRCSKFSLVWMGHTISALRQLRGHSIGSEKMSEVEDDDDINAIVKELRIGSQFPARYLGMLRRYINDMREALGEVSRVLVPGGTAVYVVGENTVRDVYIRNSVIISSVAKLSGLVLKERRSRALPANRRYLPPAGNSGSSLLDLRMRREVVLAFRKPSRKVA